MSRIEQALKKATEMRKGIIAQDEDVPREPKATQPVLSEATCDRINAEHMLVTVNEPHSPAAEEFRKLKQNLVRVTQKNGFQNSILVTSGTVGEGKSITATNLAISLAQEYDHTVLLVDADLRRPTCENLLCMAPEFGLSNCLTEGRDVSEAMIRTGLGKLSFLPAGTPVSNPGELLASQRMKQVLSEMRNRYSDRYIIIDSPPILPFAETRSLARMVDGVVLVVKEGQVTQHELRDTIEAMHGANILGAVYNQASMHVLSSRFSGYAKYKFYYAT